MELLECKACNYFTDVKCNYTRHLKSSKHDKKMRVQNLPTMITDELTCKKCEKVFKSDESMRKHINYRCKETKDNPELRYKTLKLKQTEKELKQEKKNNEKLIEKQIELQQQTIELQQKLLCRLEPNHTTNNTVNIQNNTYILPYKDTDTSHLTRKDYAFCIKPDGVKRLIEKIHFNPMKPENQNLTITNLTDKYMMVYDGSQWKKVLKSELNKIYNHKEALLEEWVEQDPELREKFYEYIKTERKDVHLERIEAIKLMIYNQKPVAIV